jgi:hypothetical protein
MNVASTGLPGLPRAASTIAAATASDCVATGGMKITRTLSTLESERRRPSDFPYCSGPAVASMSTGFPTLAAAGRNALNRAIVSGWRGERSSPCAAQTSAERIPGPPALVRIATRRPFGTGWCARSAATSKSSSSVSVRMTPA